MPTFEVRIDGLAKLQQRITQAAAQLSVATAEATKVAASIVEREMKNQLRTTSHQRGTLTPSAPGSPPSLISGTLMRSIAVEGPTGGLGVYTASIGPTAIYGRIQELGGFTGRGHRVHLPARPYVDPGWNAARPLVEAAYLTAWSQVFR